MEVNFPNSALNLDETATFRVKFKAPGSAREAQNPVRATLEDWNANTDHIFNGHSDPLDTVWANFAAEVVPS